MGCCRLLDDYGATRRCKNSKRASPPRARRLGLAHLRAAGAGLLVGRLVGWLFGPYPSQRSCATVARFESFDQVPQSLATHCDSGGHLGTPMNPSQSGGGNQQMTRGLLGLGTQFRCTVALAIHQGTYPMKLDL